MTMLKSVLLALSLLAAPVAVLAQTAPVEPAGAVPAVSLSDSAPAATAPAASPPVADIVAPVTGIGEPVSGSLTLQGQVTPNGRQALWIHDIVLMPIITIISLLVLALLIWVAFRYRRSANPIPSKTSHNTFIEVLWTLLPVLILVGIAVPSISLLAAQYKPPGHDALTIKVTGNQWYWTYQYPDNGDFEIVSNMLKEPGDAGVAPGARTRTDADGPRLLAVDNRLVLPVGRQIKVIVTSNDVIHSFGIPAFWTKMDAVPGRLNEVSFTIEKEGVYFGQCYELCGARHGFMPIAVEAVSPARYAAWVRSQGGTMPGDKPAASPEAPEAMDAAAPAPLVPPPPPADAITAPIVTNQAATGNTDD